MAGKSSDQNALRERAAVSPGGCDALFPSWRRRSSLAGFGAVLVLGAVMLFGADAFASRKLVTHRGLEAHVTDDFACAKQVAVIVVGEAGTVFQGERRALQRLVGGVRATLSFECSGITDIVLLGQSGGKTVWRGLVSEKNGWVLVDMPFAPVKTPSKTTVTAKTAPAPKTKAIPAGSGTLALPSFGGGSASARGMEAEAEFMMLLP